MAPGNGDLRVRAGRHRQPRAGRIDSPSVTTTARGGAHGGDRAKKGTGRKRQSLVDTLGWLLAVVGPAANVPERDGAQQRLGLRRHGLTCLRWLWADSA